VIAQLPFKQTNLVEVAPLRRDLLTHGPVHKIRTRVGHDAWLVTGHAQVQRMLDVEIAGNDG
jgi:pentalenolactone synthase